MCFQVDINATRPVNRIAWKIVEFSRKGYLRSLIYPTKNWQENVPQYMAGSGPMSVGSPFAKRAERGIYVYLSKPPKYMYDNDQDALLRVEVDPEDWLYTCNKASAEVNIYSLKGIYIATYKKATPTTQQPDIEWVR